MQKKKYTMRNDKRATKKMQHYEMGFAIRAKSHGEQPKCNWVTHNKKKTSGKHRSKNTQCEILKNTSRKTYSEKHKIIQSQCPQNTIFPQTKKQYTKKNNAMF